MSTDCEYILNDFDSRSWAEPARMILTYAGVNWKDNRYGKVGTPDDIKSSLCFGQMPQLAFEGKYLTQSFTIYRYLAKKFGLAGNDDFEAAQCDEITETCKDVIDLFKPHFHIQDEETRKVKFEEAAAIAKQRFLRKFNEILQVNGGYLVGNSLTWADIVAVFYLYQIRELINIDLTADLPALSSLINVVSNVKGIKERFAVLKGETP